MSYLSISPSPFSCFIRRLCCSRTVTSTPRSRLHRLRRTVPDPKARVKRTSARAPRSLATWPIPRTKQAMSAKSSTRLLLQTLTRRPSAIRTTITSLTSRKSHARTKDCSVCPQCWKPLFCTLLIGNFALKRGSQESMPRETVAKQGERREREGAVISVTESMSKKSRRNSIRIRSLRTHRGLYSDEISENTLDEELNRTFLVNSSAKIFWLRTTWRSTIWSEEIQNTHSSHSVSLNLKDDNCWTPMGRSSPASENTLLLWIGDEEPSSPGMLRKKLPRNWRIEKTLL